MSTFPQVGEPFVDRYVLKEVLGEGSFARVFRAADDGLGRDVAIKILKPDKGAVDAERAARRFSKEMKLVASITDPHVVQLFDYGRTEDGLMYMVLELVPGRDLDEMLAEGPLDEDDALRVMSQVLEALRAAHNAGTLHRDVKPGNIRIYEYMGDRMRTKLLDFGIAKSQHDDAGLTATGMTVGTPRFMAPEQLFGEPLGPTSDLYSVALVTYEMLTGEPLDHMRQLANAEQVVIEPHPKVREPLRKLLNRMLQDRPADRYPTVDAVLRALERLPTVETNARERSVESEESDPLHDADTVVQPVRTRKPPPATTVKGRARDGEQNRREATRRLAVLSLFAIVAGAGIGLIILWLTAPSPVEDPEGAEDQREHTLPLRRVLAGNRSESGPPKPSSTDEGPAGVTTNTNTKAPVVTRSGCGRRPAHEGTAALDIADGLRRIEWRVHVPTGYDPNVPHPVVLLFHDDASRPGRVISKTGLDETADEHGFLIVAPTDPDVAPVWSDEHLDDARVVLEETAAMFCIDRRRVFAVGHGGGGEAVVRLTCEDWIHGFVAASYIPQHTRHRCTPTQPAPLLYFAPMKTRFQPPEGGRGCAGITRISYDAFEGMWRERNGCSDEVALLHERDDGSCRRWSCTSPFVSCRVEGGRRWPGAPVRATDVLKCDGPPHEFPHNEVLWEFLSSLEQ